MKEVQDHYFHLAKKEGYVARSVYKLQEIDQKFHFFGPHTRTVIDIGCAPGSWLQYTSKQLSSYHYTGHSGLADSLTRGAIDSPNIIGFDLKKVDLNLPFTTTFVQDISDQEAVKRILNEQLGMSDEQLGMSNERLAINNENNSPLGVDIIISDMAPDTIGNKGADALRSSALIMETMRMYEQLLKADGKFTIKVFMGPGFEELVHYCRDQRGSKSIKIFKPKACRKESKETYIVKI